MARKVIGIGETILDILFKNNQPTAAVPGGSVFNGIISLGRMGVNVDFISETGNDKVGNIILDFMKENGAFSRNKDGQYHIDYEKALKAIDDWAGLIIKTQATGDAEFARTFSAEYAVVPEALSADIANINAHNIPRDIKFDFVW